MLILIINFCVVINWKLERENIYVIYIVKCKFMSFKVEERNYKYISLNLN